MGVQISLLLDRSRGDTLTEQLAAQLRDAIRMGRITPGTRLPSSRRLAEQLGIGRNTAVRAYEVLEMEAYVETRPASGMFAALPSVTVPPGRATDVPAGSAVRARVSPGGGAGARARLSFDFAPGRPNPGLFPLKAWRRLLQGCLSQNGAQGLTQPMDPLGLASLRSAIATYIAAARGIITEPGQIIVVGSTDEAVSLSARLLLSPGAVACLENPGCRRVATLFQAMGARLHAVDVDEAGLIAEDLPPRPAVLHVTPSHQYPTGHAMTQSRRDSLATWARRTGCMILEDDRGVEFRYEGGAPLAIAAQAPDQTIYIGSFAQALGHGIGLAYLVVPHSLIEAARAVRAIASAGGSWLEQAALADMIRGGAFASHVMRMRAEYKLRRDHLLDALERNFGDVAVSGAAGGLHVFWQLPPGVPDATTVQALGHRARVGVYPLDPACVHDAAPGLLVRRGVMLGYAALTPRQIEQGIARLSDAVDDALDGHRIGLHDLLVYRPLASSRADISGRRTAKPAPRNRQQPALPAGVPLRAASAADVSTGSGRIMPTVSELYQYPIKGLSPQSVDRARIRAGQPFPFDRLFALARPGTAVTADDPKWAKKGLFVMLMLDEALASVQTRLDGETLHLTVRRGAETMLTADLNDASAHPVVEAFFHRLVPSLRAPPVLVRAREGHFMDKPDNVISLINLATIRALEKQWDCRIDRLRFRANIYIDGAPAWSEFAWVGSDIRIGSGTFRVDRRNGRCSATNVDPATGRRDLDIPGSLRKAFGHKDLGVYLVARNDAELAVGDRLDGADVARLAAARPVAPAGGHGAYICRGCYFVYHEALGVPGQGIAPGTSVGDLPQSWQCPDCGTDKTALRPYRG